MTSTLALVLVASLLQIPPVNVTIATVAPDSRADIRLIPEGEVEIRRDGTITRVKVEIDQIPPSSRPDFRAWVVWAVSPEGEFENLGELTPDGRGGELETATSMTRLGLLVTAEPYYSVESPGPIVRFRSGPARNRDTRVDPLDVEIGRTDYSGFTLPPQGSIHPRVSQARLALDIAENAASGQTASASLRQARVARDSMEQLLRRDTPIEVVLGYANDSIRLADLAVRQARVAADRDRLVQANERARSLEQELTRADDDLERSEARERDAAVRTNELLAELETARNVNRSLTLERDAAQRDLAAAEAEIRSISDPWRPLVSALIYGFAARETPRGLLLTLPDDAFDDDDLTVAGREWLARLGGALAFGEVPEVWVEGHGIVENPRESEARALGVRDYLVSTGLPDTMVHGEGLGSRVPIPGTEADDPINERTEILIRPFGG